MEDKTPFSISQKSRSSLFFPTPETVKARSLLALRRQQMATIAHRNAGMNTPWLKKENSLKDRSLKSAVRKPEKKPEKVPWLGVGFQNYSHLHRETQKLEVASTTRRAMPDRFKDPPVRQVSMNSKDVQVTIIPDSSRILMPLKKVQVGDYVPEDRTQTTAHFDYQLFFEIRRRVKQSQRERQQEDARKAELSASLTTVTAEPNVLNSQEALKPQTAPSPTKPLLRKTLSRPVPCVVPPATYSLGIASAPRSKSSFSVSRIRRNTAAKTRRPREDQPSLPFPASCEPSTDSLKLPVAPSRSVSVLDLRTKHTLPPHRIPVEFHLFRRVKKSSLGRLRSL